MNGGSRHPGVVSACSPASELKLQVSRGRIELLIRVHCETGYSSSQIVRNALQRSNDGDTVVAGQREVLRNV